MFSSTWKKIQQGDFSPIYLLVGTEHYFFDETIRRMKESLNQNGETDVLLFDLDEVPVQHVIEEADTIPFFTERKLIIAKNASFLKATEKGKEKIDHDLKKFESWVQNPSETAITIFIAPYEKLDERKKVTKLMKEKSLLLVAKPLEGNDLVVWVKSIVAREKKTMTSEAITRLIETVGQDLVQLQSEIHKMATYIGEGLEITKDDVELLMTRTLEQDAFQLLNAYLRGDTTTALTVYHDLLRQKQEPIMLTALLASQIRLLSNVKYLQKKGYHAQAIAKQLKVNPYRVKLIVESRQQVKEQRLLQVLHRLASADYQLKTSSGRRERILELFLMNRL
ncbi:DNA polymerase III subunit delta [Paenisporosarcina antarctica]|uniref:DNA polymerase III subunit delta n=1 Tax=Paenisporosarcina antarctica TaxID=417367 RepID=A0A4P6ZWQ7_9BACL|nr:DNA polymerase III subunit delta [Paenisporosarcina antarctica]QBP40851.1 DNA polymerase III subunit delta [Paenisporosarcina antarctica]